MLNGLGMKIMCGRDAVPGGNWCVCLEASWVQVESPLIPHAVLQLNLSSVSCFQFILFLEEQKEFSTPAVFFL